MSQHQNITIYDIGLRFQSVGLRIDRIIILNESTNSISISYPKFTCNIVNICVIEVCAEKGLHVNMTTWKLHSQDVLQCVTQK